MKHVLLITMILIFSPAQANNQLKERAMKSKVIMQEFMLELKGELQTSMKASGPIATIDVCKNKAPAIAKKLSDKTGWKVARTSLKPRNANNTPDAWETKVLHEFEKRKNKGEKIKPMAYFKNVNNNGVESFRFMKAIPTGKPCLTCHGGNIKPDLAAKLDASYPEDKARGFKLGDIRGAFTITQPVN